MPDDVRAEHVPRPDLRLQVLLLLKRIWINPKGLAASLWFCVNSWGRVKKKKLQNKACVACHTRLNNKSGNQEQLSITSRKAKNDPANLNNMSAMWLSS